MTCGDVLPRVPPASKTTGAAQNCGWAQALLTCKACDPQAGKHKASLPCRLHKCLHVCWQGPGRLRSQGARHNSPAAKDELAGAVMNQPKHQISATALQQKTDLQEQ